MRGPALVSARCRRRAPWLSAVDAFRGSGGCPPIMAVYVDGQWLNHHGCRTRVTTFLLSSAALCRSFRDAYSQSRAYRCRNYRAVAVARFRFTLPRGLPSSVPASRRRRSCWPVPLSATAGSARLSSASALGRLPSSAPASSPGRFFRPALASASARPPWPPLGGRRRDRSGGSWPLLLHVGPLVVVDELGFAGVENPDKAALV